MIIAHAKSSKKISKAKAKRYIDLLAKGKKEYKFDTHKGFRFTKGTMKEPGSRFYSIEKFAGITVRIPFKVTEFTDDHFTFKVMGIAHPFDAYGTFYIDKKIGLKIYSESGGLLLKMVMPILRPLVKKQIKKEIAFLEREITLLPSS